MPKPPKSPSELSTSTSGQSRRPSAGRRTSSSEKVKKDIANASGKHGLKSPGLSTSKTKMPGSSGDSKTSHGSETSDIVSGKSNVKGNDTKSAVRTGVPGSAPSSPAVLSMAQPPESTSQIEIERLRAAMNAQLLLNQQRDNLSRQLSERAGQLADRPIQPGKSKVSPIHEEVSLMSPSLDAAFASPMPTGMETTSTESNKTIRGGITPGIAVRTPSYPFPPMKTPRTLSWGSHHPFTTLSPTVAPKNFSGEMTEGPSDRVLSGSATPLSTATFRGPGTDEDDSESPNLYELSLALSSEPGLEPWWSTVTDMMREIYKADRVTLSVPADATDIENVPWGQKATFNAAEEDYLSLTYLPRGSSLVPSSGGTIDSTDSETADDLGDLGPGHTVQSQSRPGLLARHSFTAYEDTKREPSSHVGVDRPVTRQPSLMRSQSYLMPRSKTLRNAELSLASLEEHMAYEGLKDAEAEHIDPQERSPRARVFPVLQALDYEADPLLDSSGVIRVLERGKVIVLTRDYPYLEDPSSTAEDEASGGSRNSKASRSKDVSSENNKPKRPELQSRVSSFLGRKGSRRSSRASRASQNDRGKASSLTAYTADEEDDHEAATPRYEEYEQAPPSPWSQSPAPSPAIRSDAAENPFFATGSIDEESFNPSSTAPDYSQPIEAIGVDRSCTVLHIPLIHPLLSKTAQAFRFGSTAAGMSKKNVEAVGRGQSDKQRHSPIAILSILCPTIPYPTNLRHSLQQLAPHLATSFSLCRHYSNLENEISGLSRKRLQHVPGFGAIGPGGRRVNDLGALQFSGRPGGATDSILSFPDSITSPSDYSGVSRSTGGSPMGTPNWGLDAGHSGNDRNTSPGFVSSDSYFNAKGRQTLSTLSKAETSSGVAVTGARRHSKESSPTETRGPQRQPGESHTTDHANVGAQYFEFKEDPPTPSPGVKQSRPDSHSRDTAKEGSEIRDSSPPRVSTDAPASPRRLALRAASGYSRSGHGHSHGHTHTQLHSYGADFSSTFQSLPNTTTGGPMKTAVGPGSARGQVDMLPPSDRLKTLMLDTLPAHLFVALPQSGEIVWVNNRYLTYRGQSVADLREDPWGSIHPDELDEYLKEWSHALLTGEQFSMQVRIKRFDGKYRWFYTRAVGGRDTRGVIVQWYGSYMDIHDQHIAEVKAARQEEIEASEAKHRLLANLIPQIIFAATEEEGVTFANEQWLSYTGQSFDDALGLGFMDFVHPEDLAKCRIPNERPSSPGRTNKKPATPSRSRSDSSAGTPASGVSSSTVSDAMTEATVKPAHHNFSRQSSSSKESAYDVPNADLSELAKTGVIKVTADNSGRLSYTSEVRLRSKSGEYRWHLVRCVEVDNINFGSGDGSWFGACTDINDHKILEAALKDAMDSKSKFLSNMSHEIRTPLIGISGMVSFLQDTILTDEQSDYTNTIASSASSLLMIINDILDISKVDSGMMKLNFEWLHPSSLIEDVHELLSTMAIQKGVELNYVVDADVPSMVKGDKFRIRQVLLNIVGNAIKFTDVGEVFTSCKVYRDETDVLAADETMLIWSVMDTGSGFSEEQKQKMFKPFSQIDASLTRAHGGTGLGLVISRTLVELHGGHMDGNGVPGEGATFTFTVKVKTPSESDHPPAPATPQLEKPVVTRKPSFASAELTARALKSAGGNPAMMHRYKASPTELSPRSDTGPTSPSTTFASSASSDPSIRSSRNFHTAKSSTSSINVGLAHFGEAARSSQSDLSMKLSIPEKSPASTPSGDGTTLSRISSISSGSSTSELRHFKPPMYSILIVCPQKHSREATSRHIEMTLPKDIPHQITSLATAEEARALIGGETPIIFTHIILNLANHEEILVLIDEIFTNVSLPQTSIVILSDPIQRQNVIKAVPDYDYEQLSKDNRVNFIFKPIKPSRFAVIFDPDNERDNSTDRNRSNAQQQVATQKQNYIDAEKRLGNKGHMVLLVEDNLVNQKVLLKYLGKVGVEVELANDGIECTEKVFSKPHGFYSLILVSILQHIMTQS